MIHIAASKCTGCGNCALYCIADAIDITGNVAVVNKNCLDCGRCIEDCPEGAISM